MKRRTTMGKNTILYDFGKARRLVGSSLPKVLLYLSAAVLSFSFFSCSSDDDIVEGGVLNGQNDASHSTLSFTIAATRSISMYDTLVDGYVAATSAENKISSYRIYFFDSEKNTYIATFEPENFTPNDANDSVYSVSGKLSDGLVDTLSTTYKNTFKIVVIGNWGRGNYPAENDLTERTIEDLCNGKISGCKATFECPIITKNEEGESEENEEGELEDYLSNISIPVYGVQTYSDVTFTKGDTTKLGNISVLKAMAKVEVIDSTKSQTRNLYYPTIKSAKIIHYNKTGYCAPYGVSYPGDDLDGDGYPKDVNLIDGKNDDQIEGEDTLDMYYDDVNNKWVAYIPEYSNTNSNTGEGVDTCFIEIIAECADGSYDYTEYLSNPYRLDFCDYNADGTTAVNSERDIKRNYLYRFEVKFPKLYELGIEKDSEDVDYEWVSGWYVKKKK